MMNPASRITRLTLCTVALAALAACSGTKSSSVVELTQYDKHMDCTELQLEITEAKFLLDRAEKNRGFSVKNVLMPLSYPSTYISADNAVDASGGRIEYLSRLYEVRGCSNQRQASAGYYTGQERGFGGVAAGAAAGYGAQIR